MKGNLIDMLFGSRGNSGAEAVAIRKEKTLATINEAETTSGRPRTYRTIGLTEARLRARNKQSWMTSTKGWSDFFGRFMATKR